MSTPGRDVAAMNEGGAPPRPDSAPALVAALRDRGVITGEAPPVLAGAADRPWFIALLQGIAGWFAAVFLLVFVGIMFSPDNAGEISLLGVLQLSAAWGLYFADRRGAFFDQLALAVSLAGQFALAWAIFDVTKAALPASIALLVLQCCVFALMPNKTARTIAALFACIAWVYAVRFALRPGQGEEFFLDDARIRFPVFGAWSLPLGWLISWAPIVAAIWWLLAHESRWMAHKLRAYARPALNGLLLGASLAAIAAEPFASFALGIETIGMRFSWWALFPLLSIALAMYAAYGAFHLRSGGLLGVAVLAALLHLSRFYYLYGTTLLWKAAIMLVAGALLLGAAVALQRRAAEAA